MLVRKEVANYLNANVEGKFKKWKMFLRFHDIGKEVVEGDQKMISGFCMVGRRK